MFSSSLLQNDSEIEGIERKNPWWISPQVNIVRITFHLIFHYSILNINKAPYTSENPGLSYSKIGKFEYLGTGLEFSQNQVLNTSLF